MEGMNIHVPRSDELTSSSDDSDFEYFNYKDHRKTLTNLADAVRTEFLQKLPSRSKPTKQLPTSFLKSPYKTFPFPSKSEASHLQQKSSDRSKAGHVKFELESNSSQKLVVLKNPTNMEAFESILEEPALAQDGEGLEKMTHSSFKLSTLGENSPTAFHPNETASKEYVPSKRRKNLVVSLVPSETPKNALVLYWGKITMTPKELRSLNLARCMKVLLEEDHYEFVLLKIQEKKFVLQYCDTSRSSEHSAEKLGKNKRKKSLSEVLRNGGKDLRGKSREDNVLLLQDKRSSKSHLFSCIGLPGGLSRNPVGLHHNDSICLKSYDVLKRKTLLEFDYQRIIYCGVQERSIPNNMLVWVFHAEYGNYNAVECHCVECDDQSHARQLSRALTNEIIKLSH